MEHRRTRQNRGKWLKPGKEEPKKSAVTIILKFGGCETLPGWSDSCNDDGHETSIRLFGSAPGRRVARLHLSHPAKIHPTDQGLGSAGDAGGRGEAHHGTSWF